MENNTEDTAVDQRLGDGPGLEQDPGAAPKPMLDGYTDNQYVEIVNPLSFPFHARFAVTRPVDAPLTIVSSPGTPSNVTTEDQVRQTYGVQRNADHSGKAHISNTVILEPGQTKRVLGGAAQVIIRQLVTRILQAEGRKLMLADPHARHGIEKRIIMRTGNTSDLLGQPVSVQQQVQQALERKNNEEEFAGAITRTSAEDQPTEYLTKQPAGRKPGRPPKSPAAN